MRGESYATQAILHRIICSVSNSELTLRQLAIVFCYITASRFSKNPTFQPAFHRRQIPAGKELDEIT